MQNWSQVEKATQAAYNSAGTAQAEQLKYADSLQGRLGALKATWQDFSTDFLNSDFLKAGVSGLTSVLEVVDKIVESFGTLGTIAIGSGIAALFKNFGSLKSLGQVTSVIKDLSNGKSIDSSKLESIGDTFKKMPIWAQSIVKSSSAFKTLDKGAKGAIAGVEATELAIEGAAVGATGLSSALAGIGAVALPLAAVTATVVALGFGIKSAYEHAHRFDIALQKSNDSALTYSNTASELDSVNSSLSETQSKIEEIKSLSGKDGLSLANQAELDSLERQNSELERRKTILEATAELQQKQAILDATAAAKETTTTYDSDVIEGRMLGTLSEEDSQKPAKTDLTAAETLQKSVDDYKQAKKEYDDAYKELANLSNKASDEEKQDALDKVTTAQNKLKDAQSALTEQQGVAQQLYDNLAMGADSKFFDNDAKTQLDVYRKALDYAEQSVNVMSDVEKNYKNLDSYFNSGINGRSDLKNFVLDKVINDGEKASNVISQLGISLDTIGVTNNPALNQFFSDLAKQSESANKSLQKVDGTLSGIENAAESSNSGAIFEKIGDYLKSAKDLYDKGLTGTDDFKTVAKFIDPDQKKYVKDFTDNYEKLQKYFTKDDDGNWTKTGIDKFVSDLSGSQKVFKDTKEVADELGISTRAVEAIMGRMGDYGLKKLGNGQNIKDIKRVSEAYDNASRSLERLKEVRDSMQHGVTRDKLSKQIKGYEEALENGELGFDTKLTFEIEAALNESQIKSEIDRLKLLIQTGGDEEDRALLNMNNLLLKQQQESDMGWDKKKSKMQIPVEYTAMDKSFDVLGKRLKEETDASTRKSIQNAQSSILEAQQSIREAFRQSNKDLDFNNSKEVSKALESWKNSKEGQNVIGKAQMEIEPVMKDVSEILANLDEDVKVTLGFEKDASAEDIFNQLMGETVEIDTTAKVKDVDDSELKNNTSESEIDLCANINSVNTDEISNDPQVTQLSMTGNVESVDTENAEDTEFGGTLTVEQFEADNPEIKATADVTDVETPDNVEIQIDAEGSAEEAIGQITEQLSGIPKETVIDMLATGNADTKALEVASSISGIPTSTLTQINATDGASGVLSTVLSQVTGIPETKWVQILAQGNAEQVAAAASEALSVIPPVKNVSITADGNAQSESQTAQGAVEDIPESHNTVLSASGNAISQAKAAAAAIYAIPRSHSSTITVTRRNITINETRSKSSDGTAHISGTAFAYGSRKNKGDWSVGKNQTSLVNEVGKELIVRDGGWFIANDGYPTFTQLKKNDIVFNAAQTEALLKHGKTTSYGKFIGAFNRGTALFKGTAYASGSKSTPNYTRYPSWYKKDLTKKVKESGYGAKNLDDKSGLDWIERIFKKLENAVNRFSKVVDNAGKSLSTRIKNIDYQIKDYKEISAKSQKAATRYLKEANALGLSSEYVDKIQNGKIDKQWVASQTGSGNNKKNNPLLSKISEYIELFDKSQEMLEQQLDAEAKVAELYQQRFDLTRENYENKISHNYDHQINMRKSDLDYYDNLRTPMNSNRAQKMEQDYNDLISLEQKRQSALKKEKSELEKQLESAVNSGAVKKNSEEWYEMMNAIDSLNEEIKESRNNIQDYKNSIAELSEALFEAIQKKFEQTIDRLEYRNNLLQSKIDQAEARGDNISTRYYSTMRNNEQERLERLTNGRAQLIAQLEQDLADEKIKDGDPQWESMIETIDELAGEIEDARLNVIEFDNQVRQLKWDRFDRIMDRISSINDETNFLIDLLSHKELVGKDGGLTDEGLTTQGLHAVNYNTYMESANAYREEIEKLDKEFKNDPLDNNYLERREQLVQSQRDSILAAENEKDAILDLIKEGYEAQIDAMDDLIDKYMDALDSAKDLYDFQKKTKEQTKEIARLEKQLASLKGDSSEEAKQKIQKIQVSLEDARSEMEDFQYDRYVSDQRKLFDGLQDSFKEAMDEAVDRAVANIDETIRDAIDNVNNNSSDIYRTLDTTTSNVGVTISDTMRDIWTGNSPVVAFYDKISEQNTNLINEIKDIKDVVTNNANQINESASQDIHDINASQKINQTIKTKKSTYKIYVGDKVSIEATAQTKLTYSSDKTSIATVDSSGNVKGKKKGTAKIKITASGTSRYNSAEKTVTVKVEEINDSVTITDDILISDDIGDTENKKPNNNNGGNSNGNNSNTTSNGTQGDGKVQVGDKVKFASGKYYGTSSGTGGSGNSNLGKKVYVTKKSSGSPYPYHLSTGKKFGVGDLGWVKKSQITGFSTGGIIGDLKKVAYSNGDDTVAINTFKKGEAVLKPDEIKNFKQMLDFMPDLVDFSHIITADAPMLHPKQGFSMGDNITEINIEIDHVQNYNDFVTQLQKDSNFEKMIQSMSIDRLAGKSSLSKYQYRFK